MTIAIDTFRVNGLVPSWESLEFELEGVPYEGITGITFGQKRERPLVYGMRKSGTPIGKTAGKYTPGEVKLKFFPDTWAKIRLILSALGLGSYGDADFAFTLSAFELGGTPVVFAAASCSVVDEEDGYDEGVEALITEVTIQPLIVSKDSMLLWSLQRTLT
jgi:hypothetical protein